MTAANAPCFSGRVVTMEQWLTFSSTIDKDEDRTIDMDAALCTVTGVRRLGR